MKLRQYIRARERFTRQTERLFEHKMKRALKAACKPVYDDIARDPRGANVDLLDRAPIDMTYRWLYVVWAKKFGKWFIRNFEFGKKDYWEDEFENIMTNKSATRVVLLYNLTRELLTENIRKGLELAPQGASIAEIAEAIIAKIEGEGGAISVGRAATIARTEVISAANTASYESAKSTGLTLEKKWLTGGANIRDTHYEAEAQDWIPMNGTFQVGQYSMEYPGDPAGGPEEVINCKCTVIYRTL